MGARTQDPENAKFTEKELELLTEEYVAHMDQPFLCHSAKRPEYGLPSQRRLDALTYRAPLLTSVEEPPMISRHQHHAPTTRQPGGGGVSDPLDNESGWWNE
ncbi:hypothetical protein NDU88_004027 [Pleurodeles waltl]|uniref:Uncharacterized protein n=1 Tax=Pleurodeles waltl TaxID=8319 RepID=A0AAV7QEX7_PLEWA|nr:hypothetical protein NDU88_004027 [Pleurodeles waltl]